MPDGRLLYIVVLLAISVAAISVLVFRGRSVVLPDRDTMLRPLRAAARRLHRGGAGPATAPADAPGSGRLRLTARREPAYQTRPVAREGAVLAPPRPEPAESAGPAVTRFVIDGPRDGHEREPRLPARVVAGSGWHGSFFHGWCGRTDGVRATARLHVRGVTLRGATHSGMDTEGQDAIGAAWDEVRCALYVAVADGLGSLPQSGRIAVEAITAALHLCTTRPDDTAFADNGPRLFEAIAAGLVRSLGDGRDRLGGACTLLIAEVVPRFDGAQVTVHGVGDSEAWALYGGSWTPMHHERGGADNATRELPGHLRPLTHVYDLSPGSVLVLGSDGFAGALDATVSPLARGLARLWRCRPGWLDFLNHVSFVDEYWSDDRSAVAVWIGEGSADD
jgi:protein phosphatase 2C-like protein